MGIDTKIAGVTVKTHIDGGRILLVFDADRPEGAKVTPFHVARTKIVHGEMYFSQFELAGVERIKNDAPPGSPNSAAIILRVPGGEDSLVMREIGDFVRYLQNNATGLMLRMAVACRRIARAEALDEASRHARLQLGLGLKAHPGEHLPDDAIAAIVQEKVYALLHGKPLNPAFDMTEIVPPVPEGRMKAAGEHLYGMLNRITTRPPVEGTNIDGLLTLGLVEVITGSTDIVPSEAPLATRELAEEMVPSLTGMLLELGRRGEAPPRFDPRGRIIPNTGRTGR
ncbi:MAG: hypothetical protein EB060_04395 [Proteobacteria bacterium]|nr:hypothetical protein [Pseudomonadota bacterium]